MENVFDYITLQINNWDTVRVPITGSYDWNMKEHIERCTNVANGKFHKGKNDGLRPYKDIVTPIVNVALRTEGFDVKDIIPYVNDSDNYHLSLIIKKYHPQWARQNKIDTFIDEVTESSVVYDLALVKDVNDTRPELVKLQEIAFCDQSDIMSGPICLKHQYSIPEILEFKGKWDDEKIDLAIAMAKEENKVNQANDQTNKTPSKKIEVFELRGTFTDDWLGGDPNKYTSQMHIVCYYKDKDGNKQGITLFQSEDKPLSDRFKALVINRVFGRACGKSVVETMFEPQVWTNYSEIKIKEMLDSALNIFQTSSDDFGGQRINDLKLNTVLKHEDGKPITKVDGTLQNLIPVTNYQVGKENDARVLGSASDAQLGTNPVSGTPFALQNLVVQQGQGIHEYRQGKIATFFSDELYYDWILKYIVKEINSGKDFSEELTMEEMNYVVEKIVKNNLKEQMADMMFKGEVVTPEMEEMMLTAERNKLKGEGSRVFFKELKGSLKDIPVKVFVNIKGKQKYMAQNVDKITNIIREAINNPQAFSQIPGVGNLFNEMIEDSGFNPVDFTEMITPVQQEEQQPQQVQQVTQ